MRSTNVVVYWNPAVSNYSLIVAVTASLSALLYCALNGGDIWIDTRARCCIKVCLQRLNWTETNSWTRVFQCGSVHSARTDWAPTDLVSLQPIKSWRRSARPMNASYNRVDLLQVSKFSSVGVLWTSLNWAWWSTEARAHWSTHSWSDVCHLRQTFIPTRSRIRSIRLRQTRPRWPLQTGSTVLITVTFHAGYYHIYHCVFISSSDWDIFIYLFETNAKILK